MTYNEGAAPAALIVAHPGHELRLFHWLETTHPLVFVLTDGSGAAQPRVGATTGLLTSTGATPASVMGPFADREIYDAILRCDVAGIAEVTLEIARQLAERRVTMVVADRFEFYNPTHDLAAVVANIATAHASERMGRPIARYDYAVIDAPPPDGDGLELDDAAVVRKLAAARNIPELKFEVDHLLAMIGTVGLRREVLRPVALSVDIPRPVTKAMYETYGEQRVAAGRYSTVLRYEQHFVPFVEKLIAEVGAATQSAALQAWSS